MLNQESQGNGLREQPQRYADLRLTVRRRIVSVLATHCTILSIGLHFLRDCETTARLRAFDPFYNRDDDTTSPVTLFVERSTDIEDGSGNQEQPAAADFVAYLRERDAELLAREQQIAALERRINTLQAELAVLREQLGTAHAECEVLRREVEASVRVRVERDVLRHELDRLVHLAAADTPRRWHRRAPVQPELSSAPGSQPPPSQRPSVPRAQQGLFARLFAKRN
jgi:hypothetical protein